jgi:hypothetical protein
MKERYKVIAGLGISVTLALLMVMSFGTPVKAEGEEERPSFTVYSDVLSQYLWRGYALSKDSAVLQPSMTASYKGFSVNIWGNFDTNSKFQNNPSVGAKWNETDFTFSYSREIYGALSGTVGGIYYAYALDSIYGTNVPDSFEIYGGLSYAFPWFTLGVTGYREVSHYPGWWILFDLSRNFKLPWYDMSTDLGMTFVYQNSKDNTAYPAWPYNPDNTEAFSGFLSGQIFAALNIPVWKFITVSPRIGFTFPLSHQANEQISYISWDSQANHVFGGLRISAAF